MPGICVLGCGEVQQIGTPAQIYEEPANRFVADFIGDTNFLEVTVLAAGDGTARVRTPFGTEIEAPASGCRPGEAATLSIRPEHVGLDSKARCCLE